MLSAILGQLVQRAGAAIGALDEVQFDPDLHAAKFENALQLVRSIRQVVNAPVLDTETNALTDVFLEIVTKQRPFKDRANIEIFVTDLKRPDKKWDV